MEVSDNKNDIAEVAKDTLETLLGLMEVSASVMPSAALLAGGGEGATDAVTLEIEGNDLGILIGRRGQTLSCLQYIVKLIIGHQTKVWLPIVIDVEGYKQRRCDALQALAWRMAELVKTRGAPFTLEPMSAFDRRIIHLALADHSDVTTQSSGEGEARKVVIIPRDN